MPQINNIESQIQGYVENPQQALINAAADPIFKTFIEANQFQLVAVAYGGVQVQQQALSRAAVSSAISEIIKQAKNAGMNMEDWICSKKGFDICSQLNTPTIVTIHRMYDYIFNTRPVYEAFFELVAAHVMAGTAAAIVTAALHPFIVLFCTIGITYNEFTRLCKCQADHPEV